jgi:methylenetetrahydrofolate dehydrogenase (NADP+)/methenyltetrahydrofolate cyclohydrolase
MIKINGKKISQKILDELKQKSKIKNFLAAFLVNNNPASENFIKQKEKIAKELDVDFRIYRLEDSLSNDQLKDEMKQVISSKLCGGAILQLPLPSGLNPSYILNTISPEKDVDLLSERSLGSFYNGRSRILPPSVITVQEVLREASVKMNDLNKVAVVGQGALVGKPIAAWFSGKVPEVTILDKGSDLSALKDVNIAVLGTGIRGLIKASMFKKGAGVIDFGYGTGNDGKIGGDFDENSIAQAGDNYLSFYTPTPGGTGPILVACLFRNFYDLNKE